MFYDDGQIFRRCILIALILYSKYYHVKFSSLLRYIILFYSEYRWNKTIYLFHNDFGRDMYNNCLKD